MDITQESFNALLKWLDPDPDLAGHKLVTIQAGLIRIFASKGCSDSEHLADKAIDIVISHLPELQEYAGEKAKYFVGVARNIILEQRRAREVATAEIPERQSEECEPSDAYECLRLCLKFLTPDKRDLILNYYAYSGNNKIEDHKQMAQQRGINDGALRNRAFQVRNKMRKCVMQCLKNFSNKTG